jgi:hypothetical protein
MTQPNVKFIFSFVFLNFISPINTFAQEVVWKKNFGSIAYERFSTVTKVFDGIVAVGYTQIL